MREPTRVLLLATFLNRTTSSNVHSLLVDAGLTPHYSGSEGQSHRIRWR
jgi:hypothetical protein